MADKISPEKRSWNMSRIHTKDTSIEVKVRKYLFSKGFRYRKMLLLSPENPTLSFPSIMLLYSFMDAFGIDTKVALAHTFPRHDKTIGFQNSSAMSRTTRSIIAIFN